MAHPRSIAAVRRAAAGVRLRRARRYVRATDHGELVATPGEPDEIAALRAAHDDRDDAVERATRSSAAYLDARRARLKRELRGD